jgi:hypothetical protein
MKYIVKLRHTSVSFSDETVEAASLEEAEKLAGEQFKYEEFDSDGASYIDVSEVFEADPDDDIFENEGQH